MIGHRLVAVLGALVAAVSVAACAAGSSGDATPPEPPQRTLGAPATGQYVALGDSYAAGPGVPTLTGAPLGCLRSSGNYSSLVAAAARYSVFRDVSCGGATTRNMTRSQTTRTGPNPPQLDALSPATTLVTLTIGGNDIGFSEIVARCLPRTGAGPSGQSCRGFYDAGGRDRIAARIAATAPKVAAVLEQIRRRAPVAKVLVVGYPTVASATGAGCSAAGLGVSDAAYLDQTFRALNLMLRTTADHAGIRYVDTATSSVAHSMCAAPDTRWVEGSNPISSAAPFHPNALSMRNSATEILSALRQGS